MSADKAAKKTSDKTFSDAEQAAMKEIAKERKSKTNNESAVLEKIAEMPQSDRAMATRIHEIMKMHAPNLTAKTWYGMPAYANKDGKIVCFFQAASKFEARYATFGFNDVANLDDGLMWPASFALLELTPAEEEKIVALVKKAVS